MDRVVVVGAGLAGLRACEGLRSREFDGEIVLIGDEPHAPYDRPPLSKQFLSGEWELDKVLLRQEAQLAALGLERRLGAEHRARHLDVAGRLVELASGERIGFDGLVIATGARARTLPALESMPGVFTLRTIDDAVRLRPVVAAGGRLLVVGAGFIGLEVAATARTLGCEVTIVEPLDTPLARVFGPLAGGACRRLHEDHGVRLVLGRGLESLAEGPGEGLSAVLAGGERLEFDAVVVGVGAVPNLDWLEGSGLAVDPSGLECDERLEAAPGIVAAGDLARWPGGRGSSTIRLEHRTNAAEQGDFAAASLLGIGDRFVTVPYVWSDQYDVKIQVLGLPQPDDEVVVVDGDPDSGRFVSVHGRDGYVSAVVGFAMPRGVMRLRSLVATETPFADAVRQFA